MSNYDLLLDTVRDTGTLPMMYPADLKLPMAAPADLGRFAAERLISTADDIGIKYAEGPERYSSRDVARAFAQALGRSVEVVVTPPEKWKQSYRDQGFSEPAAESYTRMTEVSLAKSFHAESEAWTGSVTLDEYIEQLVQRSSATKG